jgi:lipoate-protein ligase B
MRTLADFGIASATDARNRGVWIGNEKIAAIGVRITRGVTMHGFALNVCVDLSWYADIVPCGIHDAGVTGMDRHVLGMTTARVKPVLLKQFCDVFEYQAGKAVPHVNG